MTRYTAEVYKRVNPAGCLTELTAKIHIRANTRVGAARQAIGILRDRNADWVSVFADGVCCLDVVAGEGKVEIHPTEAR